MAESEAVEFRLEFAPATKELNDVLSGEAQRAAASMSGGVPGGAGGGLGGGTGGGGFGGGPAGGETAPVGGGGGEEAASAAEAFQAQADALLGIQTATIEQMAANQQVGAEMLAQTDADLAAKKMANMEAETAAKAAQAGAIGKIEADKAAVGIASTQAESDAKKAMTDQELAREKAKNDAVKAQRMQAAADVLNNLQVLAKGNKEFGALFKAGAVAKTIIDTYSGAQAAFTSLAGIPIVGSVLGAAAAAAAIAAGFVRVNQIRSQEFQQGGFPAGPNAMIRVNERGQEAVLNAQAVNRLGFGGVNALNNGIMNQRSITNEITFSPTINIGSDAPSNLLQVLRQNKEEFARFFEEDVVKRGFLG